MAKGRIKADPFHILPSAWGAPLAVNWLVSFELEERTICRPGSADRIHQWEPVSVWAF